MFDHCHFELVELSNSVLNLTIKYHRLNTCGMSAPSFRASNRMRTPCISPNPPKGRHAGGTYPDRQPKESMPSLSQGLSGLFGGAIDCCLQLCREQVSHMAGSRMMSTTSTRTVGSSKQVSAMAGGNDVPGAIAVTHPYRVPPSPYTPLLSSLPTHPLQTVGFFEIAPSRYEWLDAQPIGLCATSA